MLKAVFQKRNPRFTLKHFLTLIGMIHFFHGILFLPEKQGGMLQLVPVLSRGGGVWCAGRRSVVCREVLHGGREEQRLHKQQKSRCTPQAAALFYRMGVWTQVLNTE